MENKQYEDLIYGNLRVFPQENGGLGFEIEMDGISHAVLLNEEELRDFYREISKYMTELNRRQGQLPPKYDGDSLRVLWEHE